MISALLEFLGWLGGLFTAFLNTIFQWMFDLFFYLTTYFVEFVWLLVSPESLDFISDEGARWQFVKATLIDKLGWVGWFFPVGFVVTMIAATYSIVGTIRLWRWAMALLPVPLVKTP